MLISIGRHCLMFCFYSPNVNIRIQLHRLLGDAEEKAFGDIIAWSSSGKSFRVFSKERFENEVMGKYFDSTKYKSFQRSLNIWGFLARDSRHIANEHFVREEVQLCAGMRRVKVKGTYKRCIKKPADAFKQVSPSSLINGESKDKSRLPDTPQYPAMGKVPNGGSAVSASDYVDPFFASRNLQPSAYAEALASSSDKPSLHSLMLAGVSPRPYEHRLLGRRLYHQQLIATAAAIRCNANMRYSCDPPQCHLTAFEKIAILSNKSRLLRQHQYPTPTAAVQYAGHHHSSRMASNTTDALSLQSSIHRVFRQRFMVAQEQAATIGLLSMTPLHNG